MSNDQESRDEPETRLRRGITGKLLFLFILGDVLGAGIYALIGEIAGTVGGAIWIPLAAAMGMALLTAGSYAELVTKYPKAGGSAVFAKRAYRSGAVAFLVGFSMLSAGVVSAAGLAHAFAGDYLSAFVKAPAGLGAAVFVVVIGLVNLRGIKESMRANVVMTCIEVSGLLLIAGVAAWFIAGGGGEVSRAFEFRQGATPVAAVFSGAILAFYSFVGFETSANVAEEIKDPGRVYPRALFGALITAGLVYIVVGSLASAAVPTDTLAKSSGPFLTVINTAGAAIPDWVFSLIALIAVANGALLTMIMASRLAYGMAQEHLLPEPLGRVLPNRKTPWVAIVSTTALAVILTFTGELAVLAETVVLLLLVVFLSTNIAVLVLRKDEVGRPHFRVWTPMPVLATISCIVLFTQQGAGVWLRGAAMIALGVVLYGLTRLWAARAEPETEEAEPAA